MPTGEVMMECASPKMLQQEITQPTVTTNLLRKKERLEAELTKVNEVLKIMEECPEAQKVLDAVSSIRGII